MGGVRYVLRVVSPYEVVKENDVNEGDDSETGEDGAGEGVPMYEHFQDVRSFHLEKKKNHFFGYEVQEEDFKPSQTDSVLSSEEGGEKLKRATYSMVSLNMLDRIRIELIDDKITTEEEKEQMSEAIQSIFKKLANSVSSYSVHEIDVQDELRENFVAELCGGQYLESNLRSIIMQYCFRVCPVVHKRGSAPIFIVEERGVGNWWLIWYHPEPYEQKMFVGVPIEVMSACGLRYDVTVVTGDNNTMFHISA
jgi:hypothetical protein